MTPETAKTMSDNTSTPARTGTAREARNSSLGLRRQARGWFRNLWFKAFLLFEKFGVHVLPKTFYTPIQDYHWLKEHKQFWTERSALTGIDWDVDQQLRWLSEICSPYYHEVAGLAFFNETAAQGWGPGFGRIES